MTIDRRHVGKRMSALVINRASGTAYLAGQVANDPGADITGQTQQVLAQIDDLLSEAGSDKTKLLSTTIYLADIGDFAAMNAVWDKWVAPGQTPAARNGAGEARRTRISSRDPGRRRRAGCRLKRLE
jgi:enamine deaminase RidA (YjgF/YER057c/UK114 family)